MDQPGRARQAQRSHRQLQRRLQVPSRCPAVAFRQPDPEGAQAVAEFIAKVEKKKVSKSSGFLGKDSSKTVNKEWDYEVQPGELMKMPDATAWIVHPSKKKVRLRIPAMDGAGKIPDWWK